MQVGKATRGNGLLVLSNPASLAQERCIHLVGDPGHTTRGNSQERKGNPHHPQNPQTDQSRLRSPGQATKVGSGQQLRSNSRSVRTNMRIRTYLTSRRQAGRQTGRAGPHALPRFTRQGTWTKPYVLWYEYSVRGTCCSVHYGPNRNEPHLHATRNLKRDEPSRPDASSSRSAKEQRPAPWHAPFLQQQHLLMTGFLPSNQASKPPWPANAHVYGDVVV